MPKLNQNRPTESAELTRRGLLQAGALASLGLTFPQLLRVEAVAQRRVDRKPGDKRAAANTIKPTAKSCILFFMEGGPPHIDLWDMKPEAPENVRGIYKPIATSLPGFYVCEHLPRLSRVMQHMSVVRSVTHTFVDHNASSYLMLTGQNPLRESQLIRGPSPENAPPFGSVLAKFRPTGQPLPDYVHLPRRMFNCGHFIPGVLAGFLGDEYDPFIAGDPSISDYKVPGLDRRLSEAHFLQRRRLLSQIDLGFDQSRNCRALARKDIFYEKAFSLITTPQARQAFRLTDEPQRIRRRYGLAKHVAGVRGKGLPHLGQSMLLARRLVEAGVRLVTIWAGGQAFDGHRDHFHSLTNGLCPPTDQALSALIEDLAERGMLEETLVVTMGEFGRTPKLGQITSSAGATPDGRDHWPHCYTILFAGGGLKAGHVFGKSDRLASYPEENPVSPQDVAATIYTALGVNPHTRIYDHFNRPHTLADGRPIRELFA